MDKNMKKLLAYLADEREKIRDLTLRQKILYIFGYYWLWIIGIGSALFLTGYVIYRAGFTPKDYWFYGIYANTSADAGNGSQLWKDFVSYAGYDVHEKKVEMNASSWFDPSVRGGTNNSYYQAFVAIAEAGDLDVLVMGREGLEAVGSSGRLLDLQDERFETLLETYEDRIVYCEPYDETYSEEEVPVGIDISDSLLVSRYHLYEGDCVLGVGAWTKRPESVETFLAFILENTQA